MVDANAYHIEQKRKCPQDLEQCQEVKFVVAVAPGACKLLVGLEKKARWKGSGQYPELSEHLPGPFLQPRLLSLSQEGVKRQKQRRFPPLLQHPNSTSSPKDTKQPDKVREPS